MFILSRYKRPQCQNSVLVWDRGRFKAEKEINYSWPLTQPFLMDGLKGKVVILSIFVAYASKLRSLFDKSAENRPVTK